MCWLRQRVQRNALSFVALARLIVFARACVFCWCRSPQTQIPSGLVLEFRAGTRRGGALDPMDFAHISNESVLRTATFCV